MLNWSTPIAPGHPLKRKFPQRLSRPGAARGRRAGHHQGALRVPRHDRRPAAALPAGDRRGHRLPRDVLRRHGQGRPDAHPGDPLPTDGRGPGRATATCGPAQHGDINLITALPRATAPGLQVQVDDEWVDAVAARGPGDHQHRDHARAADERADPDRLAPRRRRARLRGRALQRRAVLPPATVDGAVAGAELLHARTAAAVRGDLAPPTRSTRCSTRSTSSRPPAASPDRCHERTARGVGRRSSLRDLGHDGRSGATVRRRHGDRSHRRGSIEAAEPDQRRARGRHPAERFEAALVTATGSLVDRASVLVERMSARSRTTRPWRHRHRDARRPPTSTTGCSIVAVGVGSVGPVDRHLEMVSPAGIISWRNFPLRARLAELTGLAVYGDLDAKVLALAEGWLGAAQGHQNFCTITVSASVAGGLVLDDDLLDGASGFAGQVGHIIVEPGGRRCICGAQGCLDAEASGMAIESITGRPLTEPTYEIMQRTGVLVGRAAAIVCNTLDLTLVVVGGTIARNFAATFFHSAQVGARGECPVAVQPRCPDHAVTPRRQRPADRRRRHGLARPAPFFPNRSSPLQIARGAARQVREFSRRRTGRRVRRGRCRSGAARRRRRRWRRSRSRGEDEGDVEPGRFDPAEPVDDEVEHEDVGEVQRQASSGRRGGAGRSGRGSVRPPSRSRRRR